MSASNRKSSHDAEHIRMNERNRSMMNSNTWSRRFFVTLFIGLLTISVAAIAQNESPLTQPKAEGLIGEQADGYVGFVTQNVPADVRRLVEEVNAKRRAGYQQIAAKQGTPVSEVEKVGGKTAIEKTLPGNYIRDLNGNWYRK